VSDIREAIRTRYAAKALQMAPAGVTGRLGLACNLGTADLATRRAEWNSIDGAALIGRDEAGGVVTSTYRASPETRAELARLLDAERVCCGTADWKLHDDGDRLRVTVGASNGACCDDDCSDIRSTRLRRSPRSASTRPRVSVAEIRRFWPTCDRASAFSTSGAARVSTFSFRHDGSRQAVMRTAWT